VLENKSAIVTGSTSGIGLAIARELAANRCNVMINGLEDTESVEMLRSRLEAEHDARVLFSPANMQKPPEIAAMVAEAAAQFGRVDILVNNAGIQHVAPLEEFPPEKWDAILSINLSSAYHAIREALPAMKRNGWGRIINVASAHGLVASPYKSAYVAAKHGLVGLTKVVALETAEHGITCNAICPGYVLTPLVQKQIDDTASARRIPRESVIRDVMLAAQPTKQFVQPEHVAAFTAFLAGDSAEAITGAVLPIDGGWTAQ